VGEGKEGGEKKLVVYYCKENNGDMKTQFSLEGRKKDYF